MVIYIEIIDNFLYTEKIYGYSNQMTTVIKLLSFNLCFMFDFQVDCFISNYIYNLPFYKLLSNFIYY